MNESIRTTWTVIQFGLDDEEKTTEGFTSLEHATRFALAVAERVGEPHVMIVERLGELTTEHRIENRELVSGLTTLDPPFDEQHLCTECGRVVPTGRWLCDQHESAETRSS